MAFGFRKSLFGYNQEDVAEYLNKQSIKHAEVRADLNSKIKTKEEEISSLNEQLNSVILEKENLEKDIVFYREKYEEVKTLSDNIGKLYLVAQTNAKAIMSATNEAKAAADTEIEQNISAINEANSALNSVKDKINDLCRNFTSDVEKLNETLENTKLIIEKSAETQEERAENFEKVYANL